ncbi:hypothetical protein GCM10011382_23700 [Vreelandella lutescens]|uniref:Uncharacterized protein n=1 Tax=Vreelandella lutescens TaxID=1602943 RepID=A0ABQ1P7C8_9GAMM|nr:hypothetical protein GCM10011382_23700 [Halomonas lutescens]
MLNTYLGWECAGKCGSRTASLTNRCVSRLNASSCPCWKASGERSFSEQKKAPFNEWREDRKLHLVYQWFRPKSNIYGKTLKVGA